MGSHWSMCQNLNTWGVLDESGTDEVVFWRKVVSGRKVAGTIRSLVNARGLQLECASVLYDALLMPVLIYCSDTMIWKRKKRSRIRAVQIDNLRGLLGIRRMDKVPKVLVINLCGGMKELIKFD